MQSRCAKGARCDPLFTQNEADGLFSTFWLLARNGAVVLRPLSIFPEPRFKYGVHGIPPEGGSVIVDSISPCRWNQRVRIAGKRLIRFEEIETTIPQLLAESPDHGTRQIHGVKARCRCRHRGSELRERLRR